MSMTLYGYWRSSASYRVRIALALKGVSVSQISIDLKHGNQFDEDHALRNPQSLVPVIEFEDHTLLTQSTAIIEYLEEIYPSRPLLPSDPMDKARVRAFANIISADTAPIQNLRVLKRLKAEFGASEQQVKQWVQDWIGSGLQGFEELLSAGKHVGPFVVGDLPGYAECFLMPQVYNARRWGLNMEQFSRIEEIEHRCSELKAFQEAYPDSQPDAS